MLTLPDKIACLLHIVIVLYDDDALLNSHDADIFVFGFIFLYHEYNFYIKYCTNSFKRVSSR